MLSSPNFDNTSIWSYFEFFSPKKEWRPRWTKVSPTKTQNRKTCTIVVYSMETKSKVSFTKFVLVKDGCLSKFFSKLRLIYIERTRFSSFFGPPSPVVCWDAGAQKWISVCKQISVCSKTQFLRINFCKSNSSSFLEMKTNYPLKDLDVSTILLWDG